MILSEMPRGTAEASVVGTSLMLPALIVSPTHLSTICFGLQLAWAQPKLLHSARQYRISLHGIHLPHVTGQRDHIGPMPATLPAHAALVSMAVVATSRHEAVLYPGIVVLNVEVESMQAPAEGPMKTRGHVSSGGGGGGSGGADGGGQRRHVSGHGSGSRLL